jgi:ribonuclease HI
MPGGYAAVVSIGGLTQCLSGDSKRTTSDREELRAAIAVLSNLHPLAPKTIYSPAKYVTWNMFNDWPRGWRENRWRTAMRRPVQHVALWQDLLSLVEGWSIEWRYAPGPETLARECWAIARQKAEAAARAEDPFWTLTIPTPSDWRLTSGDHRSFNHYKETEHPN